MTVAEAPGVRATPHTLNADVLSYSKDFCGPNSTSEQTTDGWQVKEHRGCLEGYDADVGVLNGPQWT